jgi:hypothetical protein
LNLSALINARPHEVRGAIASFLCAFFMFSGYTIPSDPRDDGHRRESARCRRCSGERSS